MAGVKHVVLMISVVALVWGCGGKKEEAQPPTSKQNLDKVATKAEVKPLFDPNDTDHVKIEEAIRFEIDKHGGELTKADLGKVTGLYFSGKLTDLSALAGLEQLKNLGLSGNNLTDEQLKHFGGLRQLTSLRLAGNKLTDVSALAGLTQLETLNLSINQITDVSALAGLTKVERLDLGGNKLADGQLKHLAGLAQLKELDLSFNQLTDVSTLAGLKRLEQLDLNSNPNLTKAEVDKLKKALPRCRIYSNAKK